MVAPAFLIGTYLMLNRKGTPRHKALGRVYLCLMLATGLMTLLVPAEVGPRFFGHFGYIHLLSVLTIVTVPSAYIAARQRRIGAHRSAMVALYVGGLLIAGGFAFTPGRMLHGWLFAGGAG